MSESIYEVRKRAEIDNLNANRRPADLSNLEACFVCKGVRSLREDAKITCSKGIGNFTGHPSYDYVNSYFDVCDKFERR